MTKVMIYISINLTHLPAEIVSSVVEFTHSIIMHTLTVLNRRQMQA